MQPLSEKNNSGRLMFRLYWKDKKCKCVFCAFILNALVQIMSKTSGFYISVFVLIGLGFHSNSSFSGTCMADIAHNKQIKKKKKVLLFTKGEAYCKNTFIRRLWKQSRHGKVFRIEEIMLSVTWQTVCGKQVFFLIITREWRRKGQYWNKWRKL